MASQGNSDEFENGHETQPIDPLFTALIETSSSSFKISEFLPSQISS